MSIYGTWLALSYENHEDGCAIDEEVEPGVFEPSGQPCDCGQPRTPIAYQGSHVLPSDDDPRAGAVLVCGIPGYITRDGRDAAPPGALNDWLRLSVFSAKGRAAVLTRPQVEELRDTLTAWLERGDGA